MADEGFEDPQLPGVRRRRRDGHHLSECKCSKCGKWSTFGIVLGARPGPYRYVCPECSE